MEANRMKLSKKDVFMAYLKWTFFSHSNYNYERLQGSGMLQSMSHLPEKLYPGNQEEQQKFMKRHMSFYNTEPHFGGIVNGMVIAMEEERANGAELTDDAINSVKTGLMGPMAGIGDTLWQGTLQPILLAVGISMAAAGSVMGAGVYAFLMFAIMTGIGYYMYMTGYKTGKNGVEAIMSGGKMKQLIAAASIMGATVLGSLTASYVAVQSSLVLTIDETELALQTDVLDQLLLGILPLAVTLGTLYLLKNRQMKATHVMLVLAIVGGVLGYIGILG
ncbi:MAG: PTS system mannose/fructose/sorbose family transporter subunit IID [Eubacteriales bacterium]